MWCWLSGKQHTAASTETAQANQAVEQLVQWQRTQFGVRQMLIALNKIPINQPGFWSFLESSLRVVSITRNPVTQCKVSHRKLFSVRQKRRKKVGNARACGSGIVAELQIRKCRRHAGEIPVRCVASRYGVLPWWWRPRISYKRRTSLFWSALLHVCDRSYFHKFYNN